MWEGSNSDARLVVVEVCSVLVDTGLYRRASVKLCLKRTVQW